MPSYKIEEHVRILMPDGAALSARLWLPNDSPSGAVLEYIPYRKEDTYRALDDYCGDALASHGIAFVRVDVRGSGESEGIIDDEYTEREIDDGVRVIDWIAKQDWCNGRVGMRGLSWGAISTLYIAERAPRALRAIMPIAGTDNRYTDDAHFIGGHVAHTGFQWGTLFKLVSAAPPDPLVSGDQWLAMWRSRLKNAPTLLANWLRRQAGEWRPIDIAKIKIPIYFVAGSNDTYAVPTWRMWQTSAGVKKLMLGPWNHMYPYFSQPLALNWMAEEVAWWQQWLADGEASKLNYRVFVASETERQASGGVQKGRWFSGTQTPQVEGRKLYLTDGGLRDKPGPLSPVVIEDDHIVGQCKPEWLNKAPIEQSHDDALSVTFDSKPLEQAVPCLGPVSFTARIKSASESVALAGRLCKLTSDGQSWLVADHVANLTNQTGKVALDLGLIAHQFNPGERIRVAVSQSLWPLVWPLPGDKRVVLEDAHIAFDEIIDAPTDLDLESYERPASLADYVPVAHDDEGRLVLTNEEGPSSQTVGASEREMEITRQSREVSEIIQTERLSAMWSQEIKQTWARGEWRCEMAAGYRLTADQEYFHLDEWLKASHLSHQGEVLFTQEETARIAREGR